MRHRESEKILFEKIITMKNLLLFSLIFISTHAVCANNLALRASKEINPQISELVDLVNIDSLEYYVRHLQNYGSRYYSTQTCVDAQNWIKEHFDKYGYETELHNVRDYVSHNVIAVKTGSVYPDEYVVCGAHYDSVSWLDFTNDAPGADDNATGTAGMMEIARVLSGMEFERTIIICTFTAEEIGLQGSTDYALRCKEQGMNILGYINIDMSGYKLSDGEFHTLVVFPESANDLFEYYQTTTRQYVSGLTVEKGILALGYDSDHTSFNQNGYQAIFPFEYDMNPYLHTARDTIGTSVNSFRQVQLFTQACLASVVSLAGTASLSGYYDKKTVDEVAIYPNPAKTFLNFEAACPITKIEIFSRSGELVLSNEYDENSVSIATGNLLQGLYLASVCYCDGVITRKIVIEK